ncbi:MAG: twin-arginine translocation signal domain-containing protein [Candidatus Woesearchaeota archaeon]
MELEKLLAKWKEFNLTRELPSVNLPSLAVPKISRRTLLKGAMALGAAAAIYGVCYGSCKLVSSVSSESSLEDYLPEGFKDLELGMSYEEVQKIRPFIKTSGKEGYAHEKITNNSSTYDTILIAFGKKTADYRYNNKDITVEYTFKNNQFNEIEFDIYRLSGFSHSEGVGEKLGEPDSSDKQGYFRWNKGDLTVTLSLGPPWFKYTVKKKDESEK